MQRKQLKLVIVGTSLIVFAALIVGLGIGGTFIGKSEEPFLEETSFDSVEMDLGPGMRPNLMTQQTFVSNDELNDIINAELENEWIAGTSMTRRYMTALIAGEGCKSYVDYGDGKWVPIDDETLDSGSLDDISGPFGNNGSVSNPFE